MNLSIIFCFGWLPSKLAWCFQQQATQILEKTGDRTNYLNFVLFVFIPTLEIGITMIK